MAIAKSEVVFWHELSEGSGTSVADANGGSAGTITGSVSWTTTGPTGLNANVISMPGGTTSDRVVTGISVPNQVAFCMWSWFNHAGSAGTQHLFAGNNVGSRIANLYKDSSDRMNARIVTLGVSADYTITATGDVCDSAWHLALFQADSSGNGELFVDNSSKGTGVSNNALVASTQIIGNAGDAVTLTDNNFGGKISQTAWINRPLTSGERSDIYAAGAGIKYSSYFSTTKAFFALF